MTADQHIRQHKLAEQNREREQRGYNNTRPDIRQNHIYKSAPAARTQQFGGIQQLYGGYAQQTVADTLIHIGKNDHKISPDQQIGGSRNIQRA
ncbi:hypothetical protein D3C87_1788850 [compost metagenome]